jgi:hypothetical protein
MADGHLANLSWYQATIWNQQRIFDSIPWRLFSNICGSPPMREWVCNWHRQCKVYPGYAFCNQSKRHIYDFLINAVKVFWLSFIVLSPHIDYKLHSVVCTRYLFQ